jgi:hypothetical protein
MMDEALIQVFTAKFQRYVWMMTIEDHLQTEDHSTGVR